MIKLLGIPFDAASTFMRGTASAPDVIREAIQSPSANMWTEEGVDLANAAWGDAGSLSFARPGGTAFGDDSETERTKDRELIRRGVAELLHGGDRVLSLGGDHSVTFPILQAYGAAYPDLTLVQFDAHPDLYDSFEGDRFAHACPFARIMEDGLAKRLVQVGVRTLTGHQKAQRERFGVVAIDMADGDLTVPPIGGSVYVSLDVDVLDPAFAPGVSHHEPGGISTRDLIALLRGIAGQIVGADVVELNPGRDPSGITAMAAGKLAKEILGRMISDVGLDGAG